MFLNIVLGLHALYFIIAFLAYFGYPSELRAIGMVTIRTWAKLGFVSLLLLIYRLGG